MLPTLCVWVLSCLSRAGGLRFLPGLVGDALDDVIEGLRRVPGRGEIDRSRDHDRVDFGRHFAGLTAERHAEVLDFGHVEVQGVLDRHVVDDGRLVALLVEDIAAARGFGFPGLAARHGRQGVQTVVAGLVGGHGSVQVEVVQTVLGGGDGQAESLASFDSLGHQLDDSVDVILFGRRVRLGVIFFVGMYAADGVVPGDGVVVDFVTHFVVALVDDA